MIKHNLYLNAFKNVIHARMEDEKDRHLLKQNALYGVKLINTLPKANDYDEITTRFELASAIKTVMGLLTPAELMNVFPITKEYDGHKYETKDYFYTIDYVNSLDQDKPIGEEILYFLWEYTNWEVTFFNLAIMGLMSDLRRYEGKPSLVQEWADMNGIETYTKHTDHAGNEFLLDKQGRPQKIVKPAPKHLKLVK